MSALGRYMVDAIVLERRSPTQLARDQALLGAGSTACSSVSGKAATRLLR